jgi:hypothetical protein
LLKAYKYLFYSIYRWQLKWWGKDEIPEFTAVLGVSLLTWLNIYGALLAIGALTSFSAIDAFSVDKFKNGVAMVSLIGVNSLFFLRRDRYKHIVQELVNEDKRSRNINLTLIGAYVLFSFAFPLVLIGIGV